jgi:nucleoside-diphosphate-sugar epimerase
VRIFVTGATGVVGRRLVPMLVGTGHTVTGVARTPEKRAGLERQGATPIGLDLFDADAVRGAVAGHDTIVNLATHMPPSSVQMMFRSSWRENDRVRRDGSRILVDAALATGVQRFVQESFAPIYPDRGDHWIDESTALDPLPYNESTVDAEASAQRFTNAGRTGIVLRFAAFYGPDAFHVTDMISFVRKGWAPLPGPPDAYVSSISHDDAAAAAAAVLGARPGVYNVVDDEPLTHRAFVDALASALKVRPPKLPTSWMTVLFGAAGRMLSRSLRISNRKLRAGTGWTPKYPSMREGWPATVRDLHVS